MKSYGTAKAIDLLQKAVDIGAHGEAFHHKMMLWAQENGLQGHKRLHRCESGKDRAWYIQIQNYSLDMFGERVEPSWDYSIAAPADIKDYLETYLEWENWVYATIATISNDLVSIGFPCESEMVLDGIPRKEIERVRRMLTEYSLSGWDMPFISMRDKELHDRMKAAENSV